MTPVVKKLLFAGLGFGALLGMALAGIFGTILVQGPRMIHQPHLRAFEAEMPLPPSGSVLVDDDPAGFPTADLVLNNPVQTTPENIARGKIYYSYYCFACHGRDGAGHGPVGESYMPVPTDLRALRLQQFSDAGLLNAMLQGPGHAPVLSNVIQLEHRWYLTLYVRSLNTIDTDR